MQFERLLHVKAYRRVIKPKTIVRLVSTARSCGYGSGATGEYPIWYVLVPVNQSPRKICTWSFRPLAAPGERVRVCNLVGNFPDSSF